MNFCPHGPRYATQQATARSVTRNRMLPAGCFHGMLCAREPVQAATAEMTMARWLALLAALAAPGVALADYSEGLEAYERGDYQGALVEWQASAVAGDARAQYRLGRLHADGHGVAQDLRAAADWFHLAADQGSVQAQHELALMYSIGRGVNQDYRQAAYWYGRLAEDGHANSQYLLAGMYEEGKGVSQDLPHAVFWYRRAAEQGLVLAQSKLGVMYAEGRGVAADLVEAWAWFDLAAARGDDSAARERTRIRIRLSDEEYARAVAVAEELGQLPVVSPVEEATEPASAAGPQMVRIQAGCFAMGSNMAEAGRGDDEGLHTVCIRDFSIARYEVTRGEYAEFVRETGRVTPDVCLTYGSGGWQHRNGRSWQNPGYDQGDDHPAVCVSRTDALAYVAWLSAQHGVEYRLPTEAEWEFAARTGTATARPWGDATAGACRWANSSDQALLEHYPDWSWTTHPCDDGYVHTAPVGSFRENLYGVNDMLGNVWEWTCSVYEADYKGAERQCGAESGDGVVRGGSWSNSPRWMRSAGRFPLQTSERLDLVGFRLARD